MTDATNIEERKIVVAVDEGEESIYALQSYLRNFTSNNARHTFVLLYVRPQLPVYNMYGSGSLFSDAEIESLDKYSRHLAGSVLGRAVDICRGYSNIEVEAKAYDGDAREVICKMVENLGAHVLVMGSHGYGIIKRALIGSVSDYCARNAKCPVVIIKRPMK
ncbi:universal stress protein PHOS32-like [Asparagus officinalis]|uniref:universal stress protein PHOS32-like n=1 Tax=Asparagus officinalis TaxID=4686 RepID=UPI00098E1C38|nr:universal stress protein PHOS32-like [Asparagus officinalis]